MVRAFSWVIAAYMTAVAVAVGVGWLARDQPPIAVVALADLAGTLAIFGFSRALDNSSIYDPYWSVAPPLIAGYWILAGAGASPRAAIAATLVTAWAIRLTHNWARGWGGLDHEDWRYVSYRRRTGRLYWLVSLSGFHLFPTVMVFGGCLALYPALIEPGPPLGALDAVAAVVTAAGLVIEAVADDQMRRFRRGAKTGAIMTRGLWSVSRHPNYFGEITFWWGLGLFGLAADPAYWWTLGGPLAITGLFAIVSIPLMETRSLERRPGFADHRRRVSALVPWWPGR